MNKIYIVGTPIGNLKDITIRALETLKKVNTIACEDTRVTQKLLTNFNITNKKLISHHDKNEKNSALGLIKIVKEKESIALVSDAGMPVINDPGFELIRQAIKENIQIELIPGVSAVTSIATLCNFNSHFTFLGFLKPKTGQRKNQLKKLNKGTYIAFVSSHKIIKTLEDIYEVFEEKIKIFVGREITKKFETHYRGNIKEIIEKIKNKGEFTIAFEI